MQVLRSVFKNYARSGKLTGNSAQSAKPEMRVSRPLTYSVEVLCTELAALSHEWYWGRTSQTLADLQGYQRCQQPQK